MSPRTRQRLKADLALTVERVERIKAGEDSNGRILDHRYTDPLVDDTQNLPLSHEKGEYHHYKAVGHMVINILMQDQVPEKFHDRLKMYQAPRYVMELIGG